MNIIYKEGKFHTNADGLNRWQLDNVKSKPDYDPGVVAKIPNNFMEIYRRSFKYSEWEQQSGTPETHISEPEGTETTILGISSSEINTEICDSVMKTYGKNKQCGILL
ncbi:hypothetical protein O181_022328 [Austropuccinia psidii MF-1]|uniref:Uncharacterized protein n=1 Tax=Austropuccinia psidii MF-1 TaxID=1389203 RepID=A0A9Q3CEZ8_9BASI|nr:hypothetical protein [Austropuccinia psidii MF-1]